MGPFAGYAPNRDAMLRVMRKHRAAADDDRRRARARGRCSRRRRTRGTRPSRSARQHGYRNAQATVLAPTGTIGLMMDCDTTGIEPDLALVKTKKLVGGGTMQIVNQTVPRALDRLGYDRTQVEDIVALHRRAQLGGGRPAPAARALPGVRHARWAPSPSTTWATCG